VCTAQFVPLDGRIFRNRVDLVVSKGKRADGVRFFYVFSEILNIFSTFFRPFRFERLVCLHANTCLQEIYSGRIVMSELLSCLMVLKEGGHFVCKLFDSFSHITQSTIFICAQVFRECFIVKPKRSRIVNSER
jgi:23S rRNA U2552 (ribose-2'-O)-methylase RlmE/FtsJ